MPFKTTPEIDFSAVGLITDVPSNSLPDGAWNDCLNVRCKDGSVQGVNAFSDDIVLHDTNPVIANGRAVAVTQFTPAGSDFLVIAYIVEGTDAYGHVVTYNTSTKVYDDITNSVSSPIDMRFRFDSMYAPQIFVFNELLIVNPAFDAPPMFTNAGVTSGSLNIMPNWLVDSSVKPLVARSLKPFGNRLMAMNIFEEHTTATNDDVNLPVDILWSSHITGIGSLTSAEWSASTTNTAGDAFAIETPGRILDGGQLGEFFIAYKTDSVIRVSETGDTYVLSFESIFEDDGIYSSRCFASIGDAQHLVVGNYGVFIHDGQSQKTDIAKGIFQDAIFGLVKPAEKDRAFCFQQTRDKEVWFNFSSTTNTASGCNLAFVYDYEAKKLHKRTLPGVSDMYETELNGELEIYAAKPDDTKLQTLSNTVYEADGFFIREDNNLTDNNSIKQINQVSVSSVADVKIALVGTQNLSDTKTYAFTTYTPASAYKIDVRTTGRYMNLKVQMDGATNPQLGKLQFDVRLLGQR